MWRSGNLSEQAFELRPEQSCGQRSGGIHSGLRTHVQIVPGIFTEERGPAETVNE